MAFSRGKGNLETMPSPENTSTSRHTPDTDSDGDSPLATGQTLGRSQGDALIPLQELSKNARNHFDVSGDDCSSDGGGPFKPKKNISRNLPFYTQVEERKVVQKLDRNLVLFMALLYMLGFLDRSNIGNARIAGLADDLQLSSSQYEWLLTAFYIMYILFEWMALMYRVVPPRIYISLCVLSWGLLASLQSLAISFPSLLVLRALLGIGEAAFGPGVPFYLSFFFKREELALRIGLFISAAPLATSFAGSLAWLITKAAENGPISPWRLLFLVEGFPSVFMAIIALNVVPNSPGTAQFLTKHERRIARLRLAEERAADGRGRKGGLVWKEVFHTLKDPKCYLTALMFFSCNVAFSSLPVFLPTIIKNMGHSPLTSQALSAPPYLVAFLVVIATALLSDRYRNRSYFICFHALLGAFGYSFLAVAGWQNWGNIWRYAAIYPAATGFFCAITIIITWTINNQESDSKKGTGMALLGIIGQCGPLVGTRLYPDSDGPFYVKGMTICAGFMCFVAILSLLLRSSLVRENKRIDSSGGDAQAWEGLVTSRSNKTSPFRFML